MGGASTQLLFELEELPAATTCGAGSRSEPSTDVEIRPTPMPQRRRQQWRRQQPQPPTAAEGQAMFGHSKGSSSGSEQQWRRLTLAAPEMLPTRFGEEGGSGRPQTRLLRSIYTQPGSRQSRGGLEGYAVRGVIGDESHCKLQTRVVVAQPLLAQEEIADGGRRPVEGPQTPPVYPWGQRQPQGGWVEREQEGEGEGEEERVAIKIISRAWSQRNDHLPPWGGQRPLGEAAALVRLPPHLHVMPLLEAMEDGEGWIYLVFPFAEEELFETLVRKHPHGMPEADARHYATQMALGLLHMKRHGLAHGDISLENAMLSFSSSSSSSHHNPATLRLIDLEMARLTKGQGGEKEGRWCVVGGKPSYCAPECVTGRVPDWHAADTWSLGVCLYMLLTGRPLYRDPEDVAFTLLAQGGAPGLLHFYASEYGLHLPQLATDLISSLLRPHPSERLTLEELLLHPWMIVEGDEDDGTVIASSPSSFPLVGGGCWAGSTPPGRQQLWEEEEQQQEQLLSPVSLFPVEEEAEQEEEEAWGIYCDPDPTSPSSAYPSSFAPMCAE